MTLWPKVYKLLVDYHLRAGKCTPTLDSFVEALGTNMKAGGEGMAEFG